MASITTHKSNGEKAGEFPKMLWEMLQYLEHQKRPLYKGSKEKLKERVEWHVRVLIYTRKPSRDGVFKVDWTIQASGAWSTFYAGIRDAACQAMYRVRDNCAHLLYNTRYRYFPHRRFCNADKKICLYNEHQINHGPELIQQQIRVTKAFVAFCDDTSDELRESRCKVRELEEEVAVLRGHKAIVVAAPPPHPVPVNGNEGASSAISDALPQAQAQAQSQSSRGDRRPPGTVTAPAPTRRAPAPCGRRRLARGGKNSVSSGAGGSSITSGAGAIPHAQGHRPPSTQESFFMHPAVAVEAQQAPRRDGTTAASSGFERSRRGSNLMLFIADEADSLPRCSHVPCKRTVQMKNRKFCNFHRLMRRHRHRNAAGGAALGKEPAGANNPRDATASAFRSSARQQSLV